MASWPKVLSFFVKFYNGIEKGVRQRKAAAAEVSWQQQRTMAAAGRFWQQVAEICSGRIENGSGREKWQQVAAAERNCSGSGRTAAAAAAAGRFWQECRQQKATPLIPLKKPDGA